MYDISSFTFSFIVVHMWILKENMQNTGHLLCACLFHLKRIFCPLVLAVLAVMKEMNDVVSVQYVLFFNHSHWFHRVSFIQISRNTQCDNRMTL